MKSKINHKIRQNLDLLISRRKERYIVCYFVVPLGQGIGLFGNRF